MPQTPSVGRIVHVIMDPMHMVPDPLSMSTEDIAPAIVTRVWPDENPGHLVNYTVFREGPDPVWPASGRIYDDEEQAREALLTSEEMATFWPPRA